MKHEFKALNPKYNQSVVGIQINAMKPQLNIQDKYMYKWQLNKKIAKVGMVGSQSTQTRVVRNKVHPTTHFQATKVSMKDITVCILSVIISTTLVCVLIDPIIPTLQLI